MYQIIFSLLLATASPTFEAQTLDDQAVVGSLKAISTEGFTLETPKGDIVLNFNNMLLLSLADQSVIAAENKPGVVIELVDGSIIHARRYAVKDAMARITLLDGEFLETPVRSIRTVRLGSEMENSADQWSDILSKRHDADVLIVRKGQNLDYHQGILRDVNENFAQFEMEGENLPIKIAKIYGFIYRHPTTDIDQNQLCRITDASGSVWNVAKISLDEKLHWTTLTEIAVSNLPINVAQIDFSRGKIAYLSDMTAESIVWTPFVETSKKFASLEKFYAPRMDRNFESNPLRLSGKLYDKGLSIHCRTELVYRLPNSFSRFKAVAGVDDSLRPRGSVRLVISGDGKVLFESDISGSDSPKTIDIDIKGIRRLNLLVDFGSSAGFGGNLDLCNARFTK